MKSSLIFLLSENHTIDLEIWSYETFVWLMFVLKFFVEMTPYHININGAYTCRKGPGRVRAWGVLKQLVHLTPLCIYHYYRLGIWKNYYQSYFQLKKRAWNLLCIFQRYMTLYILEDLNSTVSILENFHWIENSPSGLYVLDSYFASK